MAQSNRSRANYRVRTWDDSEIECTSVADLVAAIGKYHSDKLMAQGKASFVQDRWGKHRPIPHGMFGKRYKR
jgi:hypothetical protein